MQRFASGFFLVFFSACAVHAQAPELSPKFDVTYARVLPRKGLSTTVFNGGAFTFQSVPLSVLIQSAYSVPSDRIFGPNWLDSDNFEVLARAEGSPAQQTLMAMLQSLLADRFKLVVSKENRPKIAYSLGVGKGKFQLKESSASAPSCRASQEVGGGTPVLRLICSGVTMEALASRLSALGSGYLEGPTIVDATGIKGHYDVDIKVVPSSARAAGGDGDSLFSAVEKLGLKLERKDIDAPAIVVVSASRTPTPNTPDAEKLLGPTVAAREFDFASVKLIVPDPQFRQQTDLGGTTGRIMMRMGIKPMVPLVSDMNANDVVGWPEYADDLLLEIQAQVPADMPRPTPTSFLSPMMRGLLAARMGLKMHYDMRDVDTYVLTAPKKEVKLASGMDERGSCKSTPEKIVPNSGISTLITCANTSMGQLADQMQRLAAAYIDNIPVKDETGLAGTYNFSMAWTGLSLTNGGANAGQPRDRDVALAQIGGVTFFEALEKLGLKLTLQKRPREVLVIDHINKAPTEN